MDRLSADDLLALVQDKLGCDVELEEDDSVYTPEDLKGLRLRNDNVVVRLLPEPEESAGGIALARPKRVPCSRCTKKGDGRCPYCRGSMGMPNPNLEPLVEAEVLAVGPGYHTKSGAFVAQELKVGDVVLVSPLAGDKYRYTQDVRVVRSGSTWEDGEFKPGEVFGVVER